MLTKNALDKNPIEARKDFASFKQQIEKECGSQGRVQECRQNIERIIQFAEDKSLKKSYGDLQTQSITFLSNNPQLVADYLSAQYEKLDKEDKSILNRYIIPGTEIAAGASGIVISVTGGSAACVKTFGLGCAAAAVGATSSADHLATGLKNFGKPSSQQKPTITVQGLKQLGLSEAAANHIQLAVDVLSAGKASLSIPKPKQIKPIEVKITSGGTADTATYFGSKEQIKHKNLQNIASQDTRLAAAIQGNGNFNIGYATRIEADKLGAIWVGDGARASGGGGWISRDGTRQYRPPTRKSSSFATTGVQANFETFKINPITGERTLIKNGHLNIK